MTVSKSLATSIKLCLCEVPSLALLVHIVVEDRFSKDSRGRTDKHQEPVSLRIGS